jgi:hypothetical protein
MNDVTRILEVLGHGNPRAADDLLPLAYTELRQLAAQRLSHEHPGQTLNATALVHETYLHPIYLMALLRIADFLQIDHTRGTDFSAVHQLHSPFPNSTGNLTPSSKTLGLPTTHPNVPKNRL